jgi:hypothetical protein
VLPWGSQRALEWEKRLVAADGQLGQISPGTMPAVDQPDGTILFRAPGAWAPVLDDPMAHTGHAVAAGARSAFASPPRLNSANVLRYGLLD